jgi:hypothetical protein
MKSETKAGSKKAETASHQHHDAGGMMMPTVHVESTCDRTETLTLCGDATTHGEFPKILFLCRKYTNSYDKVPSNQRRNRHVTSSVNILTYEYNLIRI